MTHSTSILIKYRQYYMHFLQLYTILVFMKFLGDQPVLIQHPWISKIKKNREKKSFFRLDFEVLLINRSFWNFLWLLQFAWISNCKFIRILYVHYCRHEKWDYFYVMEAKNWPFFSFFFFLENWLKYFFSRSHQNFFMIFDQNLQKFHQNQ